MHKPYVQEWTRVALNGAVGCGYAVHTSCCERLCCTVFCKKKNEKMVASAFIEPLSPSPSSPPHSLTHLCNCASHVPSSSPKHKKPSWPTSNYFKFKYIECANYGLIQTL